MASLCRTIANAQPASMLPLVGACGREPHRVHSWPRERPPCPRRCRAPRLRRCAGQAARAPHRTADSRSCARVDRRNSAHRTGRIRARDGRTDGRADLRVDGICVRAVGNRMRSRLGLICRKATPTLSAHRVAGRSRRRILGQSRGAEPIGRSGHGRATTRAAADRMWARSADRRGSRAAGRVVRSRPASTRRTGHPVRRWLMRSRCRAHARDPDPCASHRPRCSSMRPRAAASTRSAAEPKCRRGAEHGA